MIQYGIFRKWHMHIMEHYHDENKWPPTKSTCIRQNFGQSKASCTIIYAVCYCLQEVTKHEKNLQYVDKERHVWWRYKDNPGKGK